MIRGLDNEGNILLGLTRTEMDGLVAGLRCCFQPLPGSQGPHICVYFGETNADVIEIIRQKAFVSGAPMPAPIDYRTRKGG